MQYLDFDTNELQALGGLDTAMEISGQPVLWEMTWKTFTSLQNELSAYLKRVYEHEDLTIILTGAGTSAFIGEALVGSFSRNTSKCVRAISTTDMVSHPVDYLSPEKPTLLISFARSGNSPESIATVHLANMICKKIYHLIITCNPDGELAHSRNGNDNYILLLPPESNDKSLAMTGSFTSMLLTGLLIARIKNMKANERQVDSAIQMGNKVLQEYARKLRIYADLDFQRAVFLGSGPLKAVARESQLKLQELTNGNIISKYDSYLGFRHGPKVVINEQTLIVFLLTNDPEIYPYEVDLINSINKSNKGKMTMGITSNAAMSGDSGMDFMIDLSFPAVDEEFLSLSYVMPAQILGFYASIHHRLKPDNPSTDGTISRVVQGVNIYPRHFD